VTDSDQGSFEDFFDTVETEVEVAASSSRFFQDRAREAAGETPITSRQPCPKCNSTDALRSDRNGQAVVRCRNCHAFLYNAPKVETGERPRTVQAVRPDVKPKVQQAVFERDGQACVLCHRDDVPLTIGHVVSIKDAEELGEVGPWLSGSENLVAMCEACNSGLGGRSLLPTTYARIVVRLLRVHEATRPESSPPMRNAPQPSVVSQGVI
jgi:5-methylcytosine-specific restriction endonuclease McrA